MSLGQGIFLTGATGLLGRYLLRDLLASGYSVAVLIRDAPAAQASERLAQLLAFAEESLDRKLPRPMLLLGDLNTASLSLGASEKRWLARRARAVIHSAAYVAYHLTPDGEPWETNVHGTRRLLELCRSLGLTEVHHVSTAFVCGDRRGVVREDELDCGGGAGNAYEASKFAAEQVVRRFAGIRATVYRPSVIVGDSRTGYTSTYHHFYRFLELAARLAARADGPVREARPRRQRLPVRLPLTGDETQNLVPVDWVAHALVQLLLRPHWHGRTFHLVARRPERLSEITAIIEELLQFEGIEWTGSRSLEDPTSLEQMVLGQFRDYWSYLRKALVFDCENICRALPDLPPPALDHDLMARLLDFARRDGWGRERCKTRPAGTTDFAEYLERILPGRLRQSSLARVLPRDLFFVLDIRGAGGGQWSCRWSDDTLAVRRGLDADADVIFRVESSAFEDLLQGRQTPQNAFFDGRIEIDGDKEKALKLALFIERFLADSSGRPVPRMEVSHAGVGL
jgi:nucleoside-diphosphate-sugar epimerase